MLRGKNDLSAFIGLDKKKEFFFSGWELLLHFFSKERNDGKLVEATFYLSQLHIEI
jgi:hypothetical protein